MAITANQAAAEVRHKILRKMSELNKLTIEADRWKLLREYIQGMAKRASAKKGGLGRK
jgi:hypothetical protein